MGRGRDRGPSRRGYDDDQPSVDWGRPPQPSFRRSPREDAAPSGPALDAIVKWFNPEKGFGFVELADGSGDVFLHAAVLEAAGHASVDPGAKLSVQVGVGKSLRSSLLMRVPPLLRAGRPPPRRGGRPAANDTTPQRRRPSRERSSGSRATRDSALSLVTTAARTCSCTFLSLSVLEQPPSARDSA